MTTTAPEVLSRLTRVTEKNGLPSLSDTLGRIGAFVSAELIGMEQELTTVPRREQIVGQCARHLLGLGGKRIRPICVALAGRMGTADPAVIRKLATAAELVHSATLLHDDVVDHGELRRGQPTARKLYGNAASVFAGDWLLVEALKRVRQARLPLVLDRLLDIIDEMIQAEAIQLECRGGVQADEATYFRVIEGKTAALFRWAMFAGGVAGGLGEPECHALESYGNHLGVAFQLVDDALDIAGVEEDLGKALFTDLREGKMTYPFIVGMERDASLTGLVEEIVGLESEFPNQLGSRIVASLRRTGAIETTHRRAVHHAEIGVGCLNVLPAGPARDALEAVASVAVSRKT
ncbi:MAG: polyprenyl synthetase family protein [Myxococcales bacterium]|nr:polyprenyl synthetase family protein [Myxococcales bacterium]